MTTEKPEKHKKITPLSFMGSIIAAGVSIIFYALVRYRGEI